MSRCGHAAGRESRTKGAGEQRWAEGIPGDLLGPPQAPNGSRRQADLRGPMVETHCCSRWPHRRGRRAPLGVCSSAGGPSVVRWRLRLGSSPPIVLGLLVSAARLRQLPDRTPAAGPSTSTGLALQPLVLSHDSRRGSLSSSSCSASSAPGSALQAVKLGPPSSWPVGRKWRWRDPVRTHRRGRSCSAWDCRSGWAALLLRHGTVEARRRLRQART